MVITLTLINSQDHTVIKQWNFSDSLVVNIGRSRENDVVLDNYPKVSRHHVELRKVPEDCSSWRLISHGANGTFVNGVLVSETLLTNEALIQLCKSGPLLKLQISVASIAPQPSQPGEPPPTQTCQHLGNAPGSLFCIHCGQPLVNKQEFIRNYQVLRKLGQGGMGTTYIACTQDEFSANSPQLLVLKEMNAEMADNEKARELFEREARVLNTLNHSGIPKYYDFFREQGKNYLAMELIHGQNLEQRIYQHGPITISQAINWMMQTCEILTYLHSLQPPLVHRDVKPANLMLRNLDEQIMLLDFGAVKEIGTPFMTRIGAAGYSAPEQDKGRPCSQSDLYAVGSTLIFLLTGKEPINFYKRKAGGFGFDLKGVPTITSELCQVIDKACEPQLKKRYGSAQELSAALASCL